MASYGDNYQHINGLDLSHASIQFHMDHYFPLRREGRIASAEPVCSCASIFVHVAHETAGAARTRLSLRPLLLRGPKVTQTSDASRRENADSRPLATLNRHRPRKRVIQYSEAAVIKPRVHGVLDIPPEPVIGRPFGRTVGGA
jgi:hypothetical protein